MKQVPTMRQTAWQIIHKHPWQRQAWQQAALLRVASLTVPPCPARCHAPWRLAGRLLLPQKRWQHAALLEQPCLRLARACPCRLMACAYSIAQLQLQTRRPSAQPRDRCKVLSTTATMSAFGSCELWPLWSRCRLFASTLAGATWRSIWLRVGFRKMTCYHSWPMSSGEASA